jgi:hypothetical protein
LALSIDKKILVYLWLYSLQLSESESGFFFTSSMGESSTRLLFKENKEKGKLQFYP